MMHDREKVIKDLEKYRDREFVKEGITVFDNDPRYRKLIIGNALAMLKEQEAVVRCADCKWRGTEACFCKAKDDVKDDWFCSEGEKQT